MISAVNMSPSFGKSSKSSINDLKNQKAAYSKEKFGAQACVLLGYAASAKAINSSLKGKRFGWNTAINNATKKLVANTGEFFGSNVLKDTATKLARTSGRQKLLAATTLLALGSFVKVSEHFAKKQCELSANK